DAGRAMQIPGKCG
ncbi:hypothetical protein CFC21_037515, partial [Triticum aestivum]